MPVPVSFSQTRRSIEHVLPVGFAFTLTVFPLWLVFALSVAAIAYGVVFSRALSRSTFRPEEQQRGYSIGKIGYAVSVFILLVLFHRQMYVVAGAWAIMALGDAAATLTGTRFGRARLWWNRDKSWVGSAAFWCFGTIGCFALMWYTVATGADPVPLDIEALVWISLMAAGICALAESLALPINDNFVVPLTAGGSLFLLTRFWNV